MLAENPTSDELSENKDDGDSGSGFKLNARQNKTDTLHVHSHTLNRTEVSYSRQGNTMDKN